MERGDHDLRLLEHDKRTPHRVCFGRRGLRFPHHGDDWSSTKIAGPVVRAGIFLRGEVETALYLMIDEPTPFSFWLQGVLSLSGAIMVELVPPVRLAFLNHFIS